MTDTRLAQAIVNDLNNRGALVAGADTGALAAAVAKVIERRGPAAAPEPEPVAAPSRALPRRRKQADD